jgi:phosphoribosylanthranilate isomerase
MVKVKICGITNLEDALFSLFAGANALGFVFYKKSPRYICVAKAKKICAILPKKIFKVGVFVDANIAAVKHIARACRLDLLQFHGHESVEYCRKFSGYKVIKAFRIAGPGDLEQVTEYKTYAYLFDSFSPACPGGTGRKFNWKILSRAAKMKRIVFVSGGLTAANVSRAVKLLKPDWVDVSSSLEKKAGKKDHRLIRRFMRALNKGRPRP